MKRGPELRPLRKVVRYVGGSDMLHGRYRWSVYLLDCGHQASKPAGDGRCPSRMRCEECPPRKVKGDSE